jgi:hypothetical protein
VKGINMASLLGFILSAALAICAVAGTYLFKLKNDNIIEQVAEEVIKEETGIDVDLSPDELDIKKIDKI